MRSIAFIPVYIAMVMVVAIGLRELHAQTTAVVENTTSTVTASSSAGGTCVIVNKVTGSSTFSWTCSATAGGATVTSGSYSPATNQSTGVAYWDQNDLFCMVLVNSGTAAWVVFGGTFSIPANSVGLACTSKSNPTAVSTTNTVIP